MSKEAIDSVRRVLDIHRDTRLAMSAEYLSSAYRNLSVAADRIAELEAENAGLRIPQRWRGMTKPQATLTVDEAMEVMQEWDILHTTHGHQPWDTLRAMLNTKAKIP